MEFFGIVLCGVLGIGAAIMGVVALFRTLGKQGQHAKSQQQLLTRGIPTRARIVGLSHGGMAVSVGVQRSLELVLQLEVFEAPSTPYGHASSGGGVYAATTRAMVSELHIPSLQPGVSCNVRVSPTSRDQIAIESVLLPTGITLPMAAVSPATSFQGMQWMVVLIAVPALLAALVGVGMAIAVSAPPPKLPENAPLATPLLHDDARKVCTKTVACCKAAETAAGGQITFMQDPAFQPCFLAAGTLKNNTVDGTIPQRAWAQARCEEADQKLRGRCGN